VLITSLSAKNNNFQQKMTQINGAIRLVEIPEEFAARIRDFIIGNAEGLDSMLEMQ
jgi:hypothetical protein